ncbi:tetratricopeptide repeat protein [Haloferula rosea]|uniref:Tetratricopeptide repeat protein n=2 Tax=Haloferula rosea TaxID=490093 RepID=A0A934RDG3_9BACT|nr:tetratricopeptide repeat protein [Haloferula rosea]
MKVNVEFLTLVSDRMLPQALRGLLTSVLLLPATAQDKFQPEIPEDAVEKLEVARADRLEGRIDEARQRLTDLISDHPDYYRARYNLGLLEYDAGNTDSSKETLSKVYAMRLSDDHEIDENSIFSTFGWVCFVDGDFKQAEGVYNKGYELAKNDPAQRALQSNLLANLGELYYVTGRFEDAIEVLTKARTEFGNDKASETLNRIEEYLAMKKELASADDPDSLVALLSSDRSAVRKAAYFSLELRNDKTEVTDALFQALEKELTSKEPSWIAVVNSADLLTRSFAIHTDAQIKMLSDMKEQWEERSKGWTGIDDSSLLAMREALWRIAAGENATPDSGESTGPMPED